MLEQERDLLQKAKESFIAKRTRQEAQVKEIAAIIEPLRNTVLAGVEIPEEFTLQKLTPELYTERVDVEVYKSQLAAMNNMLAQIKAKIVEANANSVAELEKYCVGIDPDLSDAQKLARIHENFITERAKQEQVIANLAEGLKNVDPAVLKELGLPEELSLRTLIPGYYEAEINVDECKKQYEEVSALLQKLNNFVKSKNEEARECLLEYQALVSGPQSVS